MLRHTSFRHILCALFAVTACTRTEAALAPDDFAAASLTGELHGKILLVKSVDSPAWANDPLTIGDVSVNGDTLRVTVRYGGGCSRHALQPIAETTFMESWPVQVGARIAHNAGADPCRALITRQLHIDLSPLKALYQEAYQSAHGKIKLRLAGAGDVPVYEF